MLRREIETSCFWQAATYLEEAMRDRDGQARLDALRDLATFAMNTGTPRLRGRAMTLLGDVAVHAPSRFTRGIARACLHAVTTES